MLVECEAPGTVVGVSNAALAEFPAEAIDAILLRTLDSYVPSMPWRHSDAAPGGARWHSSVLMQGPTTDRVAVSILEGQARDFATVIVGDAEGVDLRDMLAEIANTVAGNLKTLIGPYYATGIPEPSLPAGFPARVHRFTNGELYMEVGIYG